MIGSSDRSSVSKYRVTSDLPIEKAADAIAAEQSTGTWTGISTLDRGIIDRLGARVIDISGDIITVEFPSEDFSIETGSVPQILSVIAGNLFGLGALKAVRLEDVTFPKDILSQFKGPKFGSDGIRDLLDRPEKPLVGTIVKPKIGLSPEDIPKRWYNLAADLKGLRPMIDPVTKEPVRPEDLEAIFCKEIIEQEMTTERYVDIPEEVRDNLIYLNRPSPLQRAYRLERHLGTPAKIYFKREDMSPLGSHKGNTALAQAYYNAEAGIHTLTTETGAGQWGTALAMVSNLFDIDSTVFMVRGSYMQKPHRRTLMHTYGAKVYSSPLMTSTTASGK